MDDLYASRTLAATRKDGLVTTFQGAPTTFLVQVKYALRIDFVRLDKSRRLIIYRPPDTAIC